MEIEGITYQNPSLILVLQLLQHKNQMNVFIVIFPQRVSILNSVLKSVQVDQHAYQKLKYNWQKADTQSCEIERPSWPSREVDVKYAEMAKL